MGISYEKFVDKLESKGLSLNQLRVNKVINQHTYELMKDNKPVRLDKIDDICQYFGISIEDVVEIIPDEDEQ